MQIFDELKRRGVEDVAFISMDGLPGLEDGAKAIFPKAVIQRCIVHLVRNSIKYVPAKNYKEFTANLKLIYKAPNKKAALLEFEKFKERWSEYPGAIKIWESNWQHVEQLYNYTVPIRNQLLLIDDLGEHFLLSVLINSQNNIRCQLPNNAIITNREMNSINKDNRIN